MAPSRRTNQRLTLVILVVISLTVITLDYRGEAHRAINAVRNGIADALSPVQRGVAAVLHPIGDFFSGAVHYGGAEAENARLQEQVGQLRRLLAEQDDVRRQLAQLRSEDHLPEDIPDVYATVIAGPTSNFSDTLEIDSGTASGVGVGMPVVAGAGFVGTVVQAGASTATIQLVTDAASSVGVRFGAPGWIAVADGQGVDRPLTLALVTASMDPRKGQTVYTSGLEGAVYPAGIPIGTVAKVSSSPGASTQAVSVTPLVDVDSLQYVAVLQWLPPREPLAVTVVNWLRLAGIGILAVVLQVSVLNGVVIAGAHPDLFVLLAAAAGLLAGPDRGAAIALYFGLVADLLVVTPYGLSALTFVLVAYTVGLLQSLPPDAVPRSTQLLLVVGAGIAASVVLAILGTLIGQTDMLTPELVVVAGVVAAGNLVMGIPAIALLRWALAGSQRVRGDVAVAGGTSAR